MQENLGVSPSWRYWALITPHLVTRLVCGGISGPLGRRARSLDFLCSQKGKRPWAKSQPCSLFGALLLCPE